MINLYNSLVYPYLLYGILVWGASSDVQLLPLVRLQKRIIRTITSSDFLAHTNPLFLKTKILKVEDVYLLQLGIFMFKLNVSSQISHPTHSHDTRSRLDALPVFQRLSICQRSLKYSGPKCWNSIPQAIKNCTHLNNFKLKYREHLIKQYDN